MSPFFSTGVLLALFRRLTFVQSPSLLGGIWPDRDSLTAREREILIPFPLSVCFDLFRKTLPCSVSLGVSRRVSCIFFFYPAPTFSVLGVFANRFLKSNYPCWMISLFPIIVVVFLSSSFFRGCPLTMETLPRRGSVFRPST